MAKIHTLPNARQQTQECARVIASTEHGYMVKNAEGAYKAEQAFSCLVKPQVNDLVLVALIEHRMWILSILERTELSTTTLEVAGNLNLSAPKGVVVINGVSVQQVATKSISQTAPELSVMAARETHVNNELILNSQTTQLATKTAELSADKVVTGIGALIQNIKNSVRTIKETESVTAGNIIQTVRSCFKNHAKNTIMTSDSDLKMDAKRIHMG
jgi:hypothetical protein